MSEENTMNIGPSPAYCAACRYVLGGDDPRTVIGAIRQGGRPIERVHDIHVAILAVLEMGPDAAAQDIARMLGSRRDVRAMPAADRKAAHELAVALTASGGPAQ
jgi:hypothetical protein